MYWNLKSEEKKSTSLTAFEWTRFRCKLEEPRTRPLALFKKSFNSSKIHRTPEETSSRRRRTRSSSEEEQEEVNPPSLYRPIRPSGSTNHGRRRVPSPAYSPLARNCSTRDTRDLCVWKVRVCVSILKQELMSEKIDTLGVKPPPPISAYLPLL